MNWPCDLSALALLGAGASWLYDRPHKLWHGFYREGCAGCARKRDRAARKRIAEFNKSLRKRGTR